MYKILLFFITIFSFQIFAQTDSTSSKIKKYFAAGLSIGNTDPINNFNYASFPSIEGGIMGKYVSLGAIFGKENMFANKDSRFFYELKSTFFIPFHSFSPYIVFGTGAYFENKFNNFIEFGAGFSYMPNKLGYFVQYSNWAKSNYITVGGILAF